MSHMLRASSDRVGVESVATTAAQLVSDLCLTLRSSSFPDTIHAALRALAPLYLECGDNVLRQAIVSSLRRVETVFAAESGLLLPVVRVVRVIDLHAPPCDCRGLTEPASSSLFSPMN
jgi:hypothetical protein